MRSRACAIIVLVLSVVASRCARADVAQTTELTKEQWRADLRYLSTELQHKHKNPFHSVSRESWNQAVADLDRRIPELQKDEILVGFLRLLALVNDSHTKSDSISASSHSYPIRLAWFGDELRVTATTADAQRALGARVTSIGDLSTLDAYARVSEIIEHGDTEGFVRRMSTVYLAKAELLHGLHIVPAPSSARFAFDSGSGEFTMSLSPLPGDASSAQWIELSNNLPLYRRRRNEKLWMEYLPDSKLLYVAFNRYPEASEFHVFGHELTATLRSSGARKLVIDMRANTGGDLLRFRRHLLPELKSYKELQSQGHVFVIIGTLTFSAAVANAIDLRNELRATLVGEPTGGRPVGYSENGRFVLPNSLITVDVSTRFYRFQDEDTPGVLPDHIIKTTWDEFRNGRDLVLEWIVSQP